MLEVTPPFVPDVTSDGDDTYFPRLPRQAPGDEIDSDTDEDSDSESFKMIQGVNVDQVLETTTSSSQHLMSCTYHTNTSRAAHNT